METLSKTDNLPKALAWRPGPARAHIAWQAMHCAATHDKYLNVHIRGGKPHDEALVAALHEAVAATGGYAPEVTADLLDDVAAFGTDVPGRLLLDHADALFRQGRGESAETLIRERIATVTDPAVAAGLQLILIRSLMNRAEAAAALAVIGRTVVIAGLPGATVRQLEGTRAWLLILAGQGLPAAELDAMMARFAAAGDQDAQANLLSSVACTAFLAGRPEAALDYMRAREALLPAGTVRVTGAGVATKLKPGSEAGASAMAVRLQSI